MKFFIIVTRYYYEVVRHSLSNLFRPHLVVYLDVPVKETIENIKTKGKDYEINSKALTPEFIQTMETLYKERYLAEAKYVFYRVTFYCFDSSLMFFQNPMKRTL